MSEITLPPIPEPDGYSGCGETLEEMATFGAEQMREYARQAVLAERERCAALCESLWMIDGTYTAKEFAAAIRRGSV